MSAEQFGCSGEMFGQLIALTLAGAKIERFLRQPVQPGQPKGASLGELYEPASGQCPAFRGSVLFPRDWLKDLRCDPEGLFLAAQCLFAELGPIGRRSLRLLLYSPSSQKLQAATRRDLIGVRRKAWLGLVHLVNRESEKIKRRIAGGARPQVAKILRRSLHRGGRPKEPRIDKALSIFSEEMKPEKMRQSDPSDYWEYIFEHRVCPACIPGFVTLTMEEKKHQSENLRKALHARRGLGVRPKKISEQSNRHHFPKA